MTSPMRDWSPASLRREDLEQWALVELGVNLRDAYEITIRPDAYVEIIWYEYKGGQSNTRMSKLIPIGDLLTAETIGTYTSDQLELIPSDEWK